MTNIKSKWEAMRERVALPVAAFGNAFKIRRDRPQNDCADDGCSKEPRNTREWDGEERREEEAGPGECGYEYFYVEEVRHNIFDEPVIVKRRKRRRRPPPQLEEPLDVLASAIAQHCAENPNEVRRFVPGGVTVLPNSMLEVASMVDDLSVMTPDTFFRDCSSVGTSMTRQVGMRTLLGAIDENSSGASSDSQVASDLAKAAPSQDMEAPCLLTLRAVVEQCIESGEDADALDVVTQALIIDNATSMSKDTALFCLTTLGDLAHTDENKHRMISQGTTVDAVVEAMQIYHGRSSEIHMRACDVLWSLSICEPR